MTRGTWMATFWTSAFLIGKIGRKYFSPEILASCGPFLNLFFFLMTFLPPPHPSILKFGPILLSSHRFYTDTDADPNLLHTTSFQLPVRYNFVRKKKNKGNQKKPIWLHQIWGTVHFQQFSGFHPPENHTKPRNSNHYILYYRVPNCLCMRWE